MRFIVSILREEDAATSVEYAVVLSMILGVVVGAVTAFGGETGSLWGGIVEDLQATPFFN